MSARGLALTVALALAGGVLLVALLRRRARQRNPLRVGRKGLRHRDLGSEWVPWDEIEGAYPPGTSEEAVRLRLRVTPRLRQALAPRHPRLAPGADAPPSIDVRLDLTGASIHATDLILLLLERGTAARGGGGRTEPVPPTPLLDGNQAPY